MLFILLIILFIIPNKLEMSVNTFFLVSREVMILDCMVVEMASKHMMVENMLVWRTQVA
jgi:hypothetical protein